MKKLVFWMLCVMLCVSAVACGTSVDYANDMAASDVADAAISAIGSADDYMDGTQDYFTFYFDGRVGADKVTDARFVFHNEATNVNELGVLRMASEKDAAVVEQLARAYLAEQVEYLRSFAANYSPTDMTKIDNADVEVMGCYVIYYILSPEHETAVLDAVREALTPRA